MMPKVKTDMEESSINTEMTKKHDGWLTDDNGLKYP